MGDNLLPRINAVELYSPEDVIDSAASAGLSVENITHFQLQNANAPHIQINAAEIGGDSAELVVPTYITNTLHPYTQAESTYRHTYMRKARVEGSLFNFGRDIRAKCFPFEIDHAYQMYTVRQTAIREVHDYREPKPLVMGISGVGREFASIIAQEIQNDPYNQRPVIHINIEDVITGQLITLLGMDYFGLIEDNPNSENVIESARGQYKRITAAQDLTKTYVHNNGHFSMGHFQGFELPPTEDMYRPIGSMHEEHPLRPFILPYSLQTIGEIVDDIYYAPENKDNPNAPIIIISGRDRDEFNSITFHFSHMLENTSANSAVHRLSRELEKFLRENYAGSYWNLPEVKEIALKEVLRRSAVLTKKMNAIGSQYRFGGINLFTELEKYIPDDDT